MEEGNEEEEEEKEGEEEENGDENTATVMDYYVDNVKMMKMGEV